MIMKRNHIYQGDALTIARTLPTGCVHCIVTSPPYYGLCNYGIDGQMGLEDTPQAYIIRMVELFRELRRVLRPDGLCFVNLGDTYLDKSLLLIPQSFSIAMRDDGWIPRSEIVWHKVNPMPESATDRPTKAHEQVFMFAANKQYWSDMEAVRQPVKSSGGDFSKEYSEAQPNHGGESHREDYTGANLRDVLSIPSESYGGAHFATYPTALIRPLIFMGCPERTCPICGAGWERITEPTSEYAKVLETARGKGDWYARATNNLKSNPLDQRATPHRVNLGFQPTCSHDDKSTLPGIVLDPFMGAGTTGLVVMQLGRDYVGIELNPEYVALANERITNNDPFQTKTLADGSKQLSLF